MPQRPKQLLGIELAVVEGVVGFFVGVVVSVGSGVVEGVVVGVDDVVVCVSSRDGGIVVTLFTDHFSVILMAVILFTALQRWKESKRRLTSMKHTFVAAIILHADGILALF